MRCGYLKVLGFSRCHGNWHRTVRKPDLERNNEDVRVMELDKLTLFNVVKRRLAWLGHRQEVLAQNIANSDTPRYQARDLKAFKFKDLVRNQRSILRMAATADSHMTGSPRRVVEFKVETERRPYETNPNGNSVVLEEQMAKMSETGISHRLTTELYKKHLKMLRLAIGGPR